MVLYLRGRSQADNAADYDFPLMGCCVFAIRSIFKKARAGLSIEQGEHHEQGRHHTWSLEGGVMHPHLFLNVIVFTVINPLPVNELTPPPSNSWCRPSK